MRPVEKPSRTHSVCGNMKRATRYRELAEEMRYRACLTPVPETREQLMIAARDLEQIATVVEAEPIEPSLRFRP